VEVPSSIVFWGDANLGAAGFGWLQRDHPQLVAPFHLASVLPTLLIQPQILRRRPSPHPDLPADVSQMQPSKYAEREGRLAAAGREKYRGTARIALDVLYFPWDQSREANQESIDKLKECFEKGQCDRVTRNHVPAVIDQSELYKAMRTSNVSATRLLNNRDGSHPNLTFPVRYQLRCLYRRQRIQAAREVVPLRERWWTVDLYLTGLRDREVQ
jgi:hypothetical protein